MSEDPAGPVTRGLTAGVGGLGWGGSAAVRTAGLGLGWVRVADAVADAMPTQRIERIWLFPPVRRDEQEWGTAVVARRVAEGRVRVYTASYMLTVRGRERGRTQVTLEEVGESPDDVVPDVIRGVQERAGEAEPPIEIAPDLWYLPDDESTAAD